MDTDVKSAAPLQDWHQTVTGGKYIRMLQRHVQSLRAADAHGNRRLFLDDVVIAHLLAFFNPTLRSLRTIEDFSRSRQAQRHLSVPRLPKSSLSDFHRLADPELLQPILHALRAEIAKCGKRPLPADLQQIVGQVLAVDGSFFALTSRVLWALSRRGVNGPKRKGARLNAHLDIATWVPEVLNISGAGLSEAQSAMQHIRPDAIYLYDRGIFSFELVQAQHDQGARFVHRLREPGERCPQFLVETECTLSDEDRAAGVLSDRLGRLAGSPGRPAPDLLLREVIVSSPEEPERTVRLLTNVLDVEASVIGALYRYRWQVELFFRWLKTVAHFRHLISESPAGIQLSFYVALIGVLLMYLHSGARPSKYAYSLLSLVASGAATLEEIAPILAERERKVALDRASQARRKAARKMA